MIEAKTNKTGLKKANILGVEVAIADESRVLREIRNKIQETRNKKANARPFFLVTAYSESFLEAGENLEFRSAVERADLVVGDGVSVWAAADFVSGPREGLTRDGMRGLTIGWRVISGKYKDRPVGVEIFKHFLRDKGIKKFLVGGFGGVAGRLAGKYGCEWSEEDPNLIQKINKYAPDILFVALGRFRQEIWIADNLDKLRAKVVIGVGSAFDEAANEGVWATPVPNWVSETGLKWLWRALKDPKHLRRAWRAFPVFPWKVFRWYEAG